MKWTEYRAFPTSKDQFMPYPLVVKVNAMAKPKYQQEPMAIVGFSCRLPGGNNSPQKLWSFLERGGGMFLSDDIDVAAFDAGFFEVSGADATAMDPNQRQMLEVVYEGLENAGIPLERLDGQPVGCYVGSYATDYLDMLQRDAEDRAPGFLIGTGRAVMANRISYFLNIKGPSITLDTACSGSLVGLDLACRSLQAGEVNMAIVAASNLYLNPDHVMDQGSVGQAHSPTALCHSFDAAADGYCKAEAVGCLLVKRLSDALRDHDPIRAIVRGTSSNSNGRTRGTGGIAQPSGEMQAAAIRAAYANAGITDFNETAFLECHGTGTPAGDPEEVHGAGSVFSPGRDPQRPLIIGSIKSNVGHSEPSAGISGLIKIILAMERGIIPGNPTFWKPSPKIDFASNKVKVSRTAIPWPDDGHGVRRASINCFGFGGSNAHAVIDQPSRAERKAYLSSYRSGDDGDDENEDDYILGDDASSETQPPPRPYVLVLSANDAAALKANMSSLCGHVANLGVKAPLADLAYTLSERRSRLWHRSFVITDTVENLDESAFTVGKKSTNAPTVGLVFTGQGAQWPQMGKDLLATYPQARALLRELDDVLQAQADAPGWTLEAELTEARSPEHLRQPEFSQPLVTALQICILHLLRSWGVEPKAVVGHSSGEIAAAYAAGYLDRASAIKAAFYRGRAAVNCQSNGEAGPVVGMLAVGLGAHKAEPFLVRHPGAWIACFNSPSSVTVSGHKDELESIGDAIREAGHFARMLHVDLAYHSPLMRDIGDAYGQLLRDDQDFGPAGREAGSDTVAMFSSVTGEEKNGPADAEYWVANMVSPVRFAEALERLVASEQPDMLIEIGPSGALAGPVSQVLKSDALAGAGGVSYLASWARGAGAVKALLTVVGRLFIDGAPVDLAGPNGGYVSPRTITDLPNYQWNHGARYWHENQTSVEWRNKRYITHDLLGSKIPGTTWKAPSWRKKLSLADVPWLRDHQMGPDVLVPGMAFVAMAVEAMYQKHCVLHPDASAGVRGPSDLAYRLRNVKFDRAVVIEEGKPTTLLLTLASVPGSDEWHEFRVRTTAAEDQNMVYEHGRGLVRVQEAVGADGALHGDDLAPLLHPQSAEPWYKLQREMGSHFGPSFRKIKQWETVSGQRACRATLSLEPPASAWNPQSAYPIHPAVLDVCQQTATAAFLAGERSTLKDVIVLSQIDDMVINRVPHRLHDGLSVAEAVWTGRGRPESVQSWSTNVAVHDPDSGDLYVRFRGLNYVRLDVEEKPDAHTFAAVSWKPDIAHVSQDHIFYLKPGGHGLLDEVVDLIAHKTPRLSVLELGLHDVEPTEAESLWLQGGDAASRSARAAYSSYTYAAPDARVQVAVEAANMGRTGHAAFQWLALSQDDLGLPPSSLLCDLAIVHSSAGADAELDRVLAKLRSAAKPEAFILVVVHDARAASPSLYTTHDQGGDTASEGNSPTDLDSGDKTPLSSNSSAVSTPDMKQYMTHDGGLYQRLHKTAGVLRTFGSPRGYLCRNDRQQQQQQHGKIGGSVVVVRFGDTTPPLAAVLRQEIESWGCTISEEPIENMEAGDGLPSAALTNASVVLVLDELAGPVFPSVSESHWEKTKKLVSSGTPILWVTQGAQTDTVGNPENAMVQGLFRVARREDPGVRLTTLDVQNPASPAAHWAIERILQRVLLTQGADEDHEYAEREGVLLIPRLVVDEALNEFKRADMGAGLAPVRREFHASEAQVRLQAEKKGSLESLAWCETTAGQVPVEPGKIDIQVMAMGVNFKDVATTLGIVPENEHMIGCECAGYIRRLGAGVTGYQVGDRVVAQINGTYVNHLQVVADRVHAIPDTMTFEEATTIPLVYLTAIYSLYHMANLQEGQSVLIHSAAGGVGIAAIQLAQYKKCDVFVTVSTEEKRALLASQFHIPPNRMFSSRSTKFAEEIRRETNGRGVDVILNSLVGELLDESWRLTADGGMMVEIGKRDIVDRNTLAMEPFDRNCSFRAVDLSYVKNISDGLTGRLLKEVFALVECGYVGPIQPMTVFPVEQTLEALSYMRRGQHMGKIVVSCTDQTLRLPIRPILPKLQLRSDVAYLIVGGLKGLCGSLAVHMARHGARCLIVMSRSGIADEASARVVLNCASYGCEVHEAKGDVGDEDFVRSVFASARRGRAIAGVIQAAMVLRDKPYEMMTHDDFHTAIRAKVAGTWNLHRASLAHTPLDFFTMLSSISGVVGNKGQGNYAAANAFMDAFAFYRQGQGLRAHTVDLGLIEDVGYVAEVGGAALEARFDKREWTPINEGMLRRILSCSILQQTGRPGSLSPRTRAQMVTGIAYPLPLDRSDLAGHRRFDYLFATGGGRGSDEAGGEQADPLSQAVRAFRITHEAGEADAAALARTAVPLLQSQITRLLRLETEMEPGKPLMAYGLDSLSAVELRGWVRQNLGGELSTLDITNASSLVALCEKLVAKLPKPDAPTLAV